MRRANAELRARVNGQLALRYEHTGLTSVAGLEFMRRWLHRAGWMTVVRRELATALPPSDYGVVGLSSCCSRCCSAAGVARGTCSISRAIRW